MKRTILVAALTALVVLSGTAIAFKAGIFGNQSAAVYGDFALQAAQNTQNFGGGCPGASGRIGCGGRGGCGAGGGQASGAQSAVDLEAIKKAAMEYYVGKYGDKDVVADARDFGCHQEAYIIKDGNLVKRLSVSNGSVYE